jgi:N-acetyl-alpha-D-muramate 1-phosphate uridylyltransferase
VNKEKLQIVILAGGKGTRLHPLTQTTPKNMIKVNGKPFLTYQIELLKKNNIYDIVICVGFFSEKIVNYYGDGKKFDVNIRYAFEKTDNLLGTAGALKNAEQYLKDEFFVMYGDSYLPVNFYKIFTEFKRSGKLGLMTIYKNVNKFDKSNTSIANGLVTNYNKSRERSDLQYIDYGLLVLKKKILENIIPQKVIDLDFIIKQLIEKKELAAYEVNERFYEIGSFSGIKDFEKYLDSTM